MKETNQAGERTEGAAPSSAPVPERSPVNGGALSSAYKSPEDNKSNSLGFVRSIGWVTLVLVVLLSIILSSYFGSKARETLISRQQQFATLLADYLNNQIYRRFTLPTVSFFGSIELSRQEQYMALDRIIQSIVHGLQVKDLRIYAYDYTVTYSLNREELGKRRFLPSLEQASKGTVPIFDIDAEIPYWQGFFKLRLNKESFVMRTTYPLRIENRMGSAEQDGPVMGVLEFSQDITADIESAIRFQQLIMVVTTSCAGVLFGLLLFFIRRAERALAARMRQEQLLIKELHQHEKLAGMGRVVASIAHEIRNPLGIISSSAELLIKRSGGAEPVFGRILQAIFDEARRLSRTVNDFLDYARPRQPQLEPVDVGKVINQAQVFLEPDLAQREIIIVRKDSSTAPQLVKGDKDLLYRAFYNIMSNSIQAMGSAGTLSISIARLGGYEPMMEVVFHDTGPGFPPGDIGRLLDPFFTTKDDGTGLGLPIVNSILSSHNGTMELSNDKDGGAVIRVVLPAV